MRIAVGGILHESNTFVAKPTDLPQFAGKTDSGEAIFAAWSDTHHEVTGFLQGAQDYGWEVHPTVVAQATPGGTVTGDAFETLVGELCERLRAAPPIDGMLLAVHGAMVAEGYPDADGEIIRRVREILDPSLPLVVTNDFHTNLTQLRVENCDALLVYTTNPHVDQRQRGTKAAAVLQLLVESGTRCVQALAKPPMVWNILHQNTSVRPLCDVMQAAAELEGSPGILAASVAAGYPYADVPDMGPGVVVVSQDDRARAQAEADRLSQQLWSLRDHIGIDLPDAVDAVEKAIRTQRPPAVLVEFGDNIGGGSPGDSTALLEEIIRQRAPGAVSVIYDPEVAEECARLGTGGEVRLVVGGKSDEMHGKPVLITGRVRSLHDGTFYEPEQRHGGITRWNQGLTAVIEVAPYAPEPENQTLVVVNSRRTAPMSLVQLTSLGIEPHRKRILTVKAAIAYRAAYEPVAGEIIEVDTPGVTAVNPLRFSYQHVRRPLWPLDPL